MVLPSAAILILLLIMPIVPVSSSPEDGKLHLAPVSDTYILKDCSTCKMFNESELRIGYIGKKVLLNYQAAMKYKIVVSNRSNILIKFNLSKIPPGAEIKIARLWLYIKNPPEKSIMAYLYVLKEEYDENWVTWTHRTRDSIWRMSGGFGEPDYLDRTTISEDASAGRSIGFLVTDYVSRVLNGEIVDYGLLILPKIEKLSLEDFPRGSSKINMYADFFSYEGSMREGKTRYRPDLYVEFVKPTAMLTLSTQELTLDRGASSSLTISESGTYNSTVKLGYRVVKAPGLKVGPLKVSIQKFMERPGFSTSVTIFAKENAMPGKYVIEFYPITPGYGSDVIYYGKSDLTVIVKGEERTSLSTTSTSIPTTQESQTETKVETTTATTSIPTLTTSLTTSTSNQTGTYTTSAATTLILSSPTTNRGTNTILSTNAIIGLLGAIIVVLLLAILLLRHKRS